MQLVSKISNLCGPDPPTSQTDRQTDGRNTNDIRSQYRALQIAVCTIVHCAVKRPAVAEQPHDIVGKFDNYRNLQRHGAVLPAVARLL